MNEKREAHIRVVLAMTKAGVDDLILTKGKSDYFLRGIIDFADNGKKANLSHKWAPSTYIYSVKAAKLKHEKSAYQKRGEKSLSEEKLHAEHVIPNGIVFTKLVEMVEKERLDDELASLLRQNCEVIIITKKEQHLLDSKDECGLRNKMPNGWKWGDDRYARLKVAGIKLEE